MHAGAGMGQPVPDTARTTRERTATGRWWTRTCPGMMTAEEMQALEDADGEAFEPMLLEAMNEYHQGAVTMATVETENGRMPARSSWRSR